VCFGFFNHIAGYGMLEETTPELSEKLQGAEKG
jgi:hypothetical protein